MQDACGHHMAWVYKAWVVSAELPHLNGTVPSQAMAVPSKDISTSSGLKNAAAGDVGLTRRTRTPGTEATGKASC